MKRPESVIHMWQGQRPNKIMMRWPGLRMEKTACSSYFLTVVCPLHWSQSVGESPSGRKRSQKIWKQNRSFICSVCCLKSDNQARGSRNRKHNGRKVGHKKSKHCNKRERCNKAVNSWAALKKMQQSCNRGLFCLLSLLIRDPQQPVKNKQMDAVCFLLFFLCACTHYSFTFFNLHMCSQS